MTRPTHTDGSLPITTSSDRAAALYRLGLDQLPGSSSAAKATFAAAVAEDPGFAVAIAAAAVTSQPSDTVGSARMLDRALQAARSTTRRERQHVEIVADFVRGDLGHATALAAAHLAEFPHDALIIHLWDRD